jgi:hypothetical protein
MSCLESCIKKHLFSLVLKKLVSCFDLISNKVKSYLVFCLGLETSSLDYITVRIRQGSILTKFVLTIGFAVLLVLLAANSAIGMTLHTLP